MRSEGESNSGQLTAKKHLIDDLGFYTKYYFSMRIDSSCLKWFFCLAIVLLIFGCTTISRVNKNSDGTVEIKTFSILASRETCRGYPRLFQKINGQFVEVEKKYGRGGDVYIDDEFHQMSEGCDLVKCISQFGSDSWKIGLSEVKRIEDKSPPKEILERDYTDKNAKVPAYRSRKLHGRFKVVYPYYSGLFCTIENTSSIEFDSE